MDKVRIIVGLDPGKQKDSFAMVTIAVREKKIYVLDAKGWLGRAYLEVERELVDLDQEIQADQYVIELNNTGDHVREELVANGLPVRGVTTSKNLKDRKRNRNTMDKNEMVRWILVMMQDCRIVFPSKDSAGTAELKRQMSIFAEKKTEAGSVSYGAEGKEHDDFVMAFMLGCFEAILDGVRADVLRYLQGLIRIIIEAMSQLALYLGFLLETGKYGIRLVVFEKRTKS